MAVQDYELLLRVRADLQQALSGLDGMRKKLDDVGKETERTSSRASKSVDGMSEKFGKLKALIGGLAIAAGIKAIFGAVTESENAVAQLDARLKSTGGAAGLTRDELISLSGEMQKLTTYGDEAVLSMETLLLSFGNIKKGQFEGAVTAVLDVATAKGMDLASAATQVGKALNDPIKGLEGLQKVGISFSDAQKDVIQSLVDTGQTAAAQQVILDQLKVSFGGAAEAAANTLGGSLKQLKEAAGDLMEGDGGNLNDTTASVKELTATLRDPAVKDGFATLVDGLVSVANFAAKAAGAFAGFGSAVADFFRDNENKSYMGLLQQRMRLVDKRAELQNNPIASRFGFNKGDIAELDRQIAEIDKLILLRNQAAKPNPSAGTGPAAPTAGVLALPTVTVSLSKQLAEEKAAADKAGAAAAKVAAAAAAADKAGAAAQKDQIASLVALQAALDPTAKAWADYNAEVDKQNGLADVQKAAAGADVAAIDARRDAILQLAAAARDAAIASAQQADAQKHLSDTMGAMPHFAGVDAAVGGAAGELLKVARQSEALETWHAQALRENQQFSDNMLAIDRAYAAEKAALDQAKAKLTIDTAVEGFGALAGAAKAAYGEQSKQYHIAFALQKAAALSQSILAIQTSIAESSKIGFPWNIVTIAGAVAQGGAILATINGTSFYVGGYTGPGGVKEPAGVVHKGEVVWSQRDVARAGGVGVVEAMRRGLRGYADGGVVSMRHPLADAPRLPMPASANLQLPASIANRDGNGGGSTVSNQMRVYVVQNEDQLAQRLAQHPAMEKAVVAIAGENGTAIRAKW